MDDCISQSPRDYDFDGDEVGTNHYDMMVVTIHREQEAQTDHGQPLLQVHLLLPGEGELVQKKHHLIMMIMSIMMMAIMMIMSIMVTKRIVMITTNKCQG